jgi:Domain of unknown function (DUF4382)
MKRSLVLGMAVFCLALAVMIVSLISCGGGGGSSGSSSTGGGTGTVAMLLSDGPADEYEHLWITITEVSLIPAGSKAGPVAIFSSSAGLRVDLLALQKEDYLLTIRNNVPAGQYNKIRLGVAKIEPEGGPCADMTVKLPSGRIDLNPREPFQVTGGGTLAIRLDIDANKSINLHQAGNSGKCIFRPVVFVDIDEEAPTARCPKVLNGIIESLTLNGGGQTVGFTLNLLDNRGTIQVSLPSNATVINSQGVCASPNDLKVGDQVQVRGKLVSTTVFQASLVVVGQLLDVTGTVVAVPVVTPLSSGSTFTFDFAPLAGQELVGQWTVQGQACTMTLTGCDTLADPASIQEGMTVRVFGKLVTLTGPTGQTSTTLRAAAIIVGEREIVGQITSITQGTVGVQATIQESGGPVSIFIPAGTPISLQGDGAIPVSLLCVGRQVSILLKPGTLIADQVKVQPEKHEGTVVSTDSNNTLVVDLGGGKSETVLVESGATILKINGGGQTWASFGDINPNDSIAYFGLLGCGTDTGFHAFVVVIAGTD